MRNVHIDRIMWNGALALANFIKSVDPCSKKHFRNAKALDSFLDVCLEHWEELLQNDLRYWSYNAKEKKFGYCKKERYVELINKKKGNKDE